MEVDIHILDYSFVEDENYIQNSYYYQMMRQNRISRRELRRQIDLYKSLITKKD